jgi:hypothetical protein
MLEAGVVEQVADAVDVDLALTVKDERMRRAVRVGGAAFVASSPAPIQRASGLAAGRATTGGESARLSRKTAKLPSSGRDCRRQGETAAVVSRS